MVLTSYSPNDLTRSDILINRSDIFLNALCVPLLKPECAIPDSSFNLPVYLIVSSISFNFLYPVRFCVRGTRT